MNYPVIGDVNPLMQNGLHKPCGKFKSKSLNREKSGLIFNKVILTMHTPGINYVARTKAANNSAIHYFTLEIFKILSAFFYYGLI